MATRYQQGANFERRVIAKLREDGYWTIHAGQSKGKADVIAMKPGQILIIQCKFSESGTATYPGPDERHQVVEIARLCGGTPLIARNVNRRMTFEQITDDGTNPKARTTFHTDTIQDRP